MSRYFYLSDVQWAAIQPHLPQYKGHRPRVDDRKIISGIIHVLQSGCRWRDAPAEYGPYTTLYNRYNRWSQRGIWQYLFPPPHAAKPSSHTIKRATNIAMSLNVCSAESKIGAELQQDTIKT